MEVWDLMDDLRRTSRTSPTSASSFNNKSRWRRRSDAYSVANLQLEICRRTTRPSMGALAFDGAVDVGRGARDLATEALNLDQVEDLTTGTSSTAVLCDMVTSDLRKARNQSVARRFRRACQAK